MLTIQRAIESQEDLLIEKTRDMGVSWMALYGFQHAWLFRDGADFRCGSRKEEYVDRPGDIDTLFEKLRFNLRHQPAFLYPSGFSWNIHSTYMKLINPENKNAIVGESANADFGSGGRRRAVLMDEYSKWEPKIAEAAWTSTADVTKCRIAVSTPKGAGNKFASLAKGTKEKIKKLTLHWTLHPEKNKGAYIIRKDGTQDPIDLSDPRMAFKVWQENRGQKAPAPLRGGIVRSNYYDAECERRNDADIAQELDIDYLSSGYPFFDLRMLAHQKRWEPIILKSPLSPIPYGFYITVNLIERDLDTFAIIETSNGWLRIFERPAKFGQYVVSGDASEGLQKGDESFCVVRDRFSGNVMATFNGLYGTDEFALKLYKVSRFYNRSIVAPENNNHGHSVCMDLKSMDCKLYFTKKFNKEGEVTASKAGFTTDARSRPLMLDQMEEEIRKLSFEIRCPVILDQCETFVKAENSGKPEADGVFLDDGVIACAIAGQVVKEHPYKGKKEKPGIAPQMRERNVGYKFGRSSAIGAKKKFVFK